MAAAAKVEASRRQFDRWARTYERDLASRWLRVPQRAAMAALRLESDDRFLDVACGTGAAVRDAAPHVERAAGFDLSSAMLARARELAAELPNADFSEGDVGARLPFADGEFTAILCTSAFHHFPDPGAATREIARVLAPGGRVVIGDGNGAHPFVAVMDIFARIFEPGHVHFQRAGFVEQLLTKAGLANAATRTFWLGGYSLVTAEQRSE